MIGLSDVAGGAANLYTTTVGGGLADLRRMPATVIDSGPQRTVSRHDSQRRRRGAPVLLVPPLAAPAICFDLRRGCSLAEHLVVGGRRAYLLDRNAAVILMSHMGRPKGKIAPKYTLAPAANESKERSR